MLRTLATLFFAIPPHDLPADELAACRPGFVAATNYPTLQAPQMVAAEDVNDDGLPDLVSTFFTLSTGISARLAGPAGVFGPQIFSAAEDYPVAAAVGRFSSSPYPAVVVATQSSGLFYQAGNGDGTFQAGVPIVGPALNTLTAVDLDGDSHLDLVGIRYGAGSILFVYLGNGDGTFQPVRSTTVKVPFFGMAFADLNEDGDLDAVLTGDNVLAWLPGLGDGTFGPATEIPVGTSLSSPVVADFTGDGHPDIALSVYPFLGVLINNGDATFQAAVEYPAEGAHSLVTGDFDGDGTVDIAGLNDNIAILLRNPGDARFAVDRRYVLAPSSYLLASADLDLDGILDLLTGYAHYYDAYGAAVLRGRGDGSFDAIPYTPTERLYPFDASAAGDFDEDGRTDLAISEEPGLVVERSIGEGRFSEAQTEAYSHVSGIVSRDFDGDGHLDLAFLVDETPSLFVARGNGDATFQSPVEIPLSPTGHYFAGLAAGDFNGDGRSDVAAAYRDGDEGRMAILLGTPDGLALSSTLDLPTLALAIGTSDLRNNGRSDVAVLLNSPTEALTVFLSNPDGTFGPPADYEVGPYPTSLGFGDFHQTGHPDILVGRTDDATLALLPSVGGGTFASAQILGLGAPPYAIAVADFDQDGFEDIAAGGGPEVVLYGVGGGAFRSPVSYLVSGTRGMASGDFDGNGFTDVALVDVRIGGGLGTLLNGALGARVRDVSVVVGSAGELQALTGGFGPLTYQWRRNGVPLSDGGPISGATTPILTIDPATFADADSYDVVVTDSCGPVTSNAATLAVEFADVPVSSPFHDDIIAIATDGITGGCSGSDYCPTLPVRRDQMAAFLLKAEHGSAYTPPACAGIFTDVPCPSPFADWIEQLSAEGVTSGCGTGIYCPSQSVTRAQMAVFLLKTSEGSGYTPPPATGIFGDVPVGSFAADWIEDLYTRGITGGCSASPLLYCPGNTVLRQQMATFLVRTFF